MTALHATTYSQNNIIDDEFILNKGWFLCSSGKVFDNGSQISSPEYSTKDWYPTSVPSTVLGTLVNDKIYKDVFVGDNLKNIPSKQFKKPWWYRTEFYLSQMKDDKFIKLKFEGINYRANIWLNGKFVADSSKAAGAYRMSEFDVTKIIKRRGKNILAVEVFPPKKGEPAIGFVDWNPSPSDNNMGIWRPVKLKFCGDVSINYPFVQSKVDAEKFKTAKLTVSAELENYSNKKVSGVLTGEIGEIKFSRNINLEALEKRLISFTPGDFKQLIIT